MAVQFHLQDMRLEAMAFAFGAANVEIAQELHFDFLKTRFHRSARQRPPPELKENALAVSP